MPCSLVPVVFVLAMLVGCAASPPSPPPVKVMEKDTTQVIVSCTVQQWLNLQQELAGMSTEEVVERLVNLNKPESLDQLFYYGVLNQQLQTYGAWVQARDTFEHLRQSEELAATQRQLATILLDYNQKRINWYYREAELLKQQTELQQQLSESEQEKLLLEQKIQALTDLEAVISTRKEQ
jgi:hypothetical protein